MKAPKSEFKERPACTDKYAPLPQCAACPYCGHETEIWSDEDSTSCPFCGMNIQRHPVVIG